MSSSVCETSNTIPEMNVPGWFLELLNLSRPEEGQPCQVAGQALRMHGGILRSQKLLSEAQRQTGDTFGFKWKKRDTFESSPSLERMRGWLVERYGDVSQSSWINGDGTNPILLDAGCGAGMSAIELFRPILGRVHYLGVDVSEAVDVARERFREQGFEGAFLQADIGNLPLPEQSVDIIFSEGVMHHTDSTEQTLRALARLLKHGGRFLFYVYRRKGPIREFTDDYIRDKLQAMSPEEAWAAMMPLTELGRALGELDLEIEVPEEIKLLEIPAGRINLQRLFYWHVFKAFYRADHTLDEMNHINFDWYAPRNAHRHTPEEIRAWCAEATLEIERMVVEEAGITVVAVKR